jgi:hypothetical protein
VRGQNGSMVNTEVCVSIAMYVNMEVRGSMEVSGSLDLAETSKCAVAWKPE